MLETQSHQKIKYGSIYFPKYKFLMLKKSRFVINILTLRKNFHDQYN